jgi:hypothetical protein
MSDMSAVIVPKSDQINADDLIGGDLIIRIAAVSVTPGQEQPVSMKFEGSPKVYRPCKSMARVMVAAWGPDSSAYVGRTLQLYRDATVKWGGMEVGGIRIRGMSNMPGDRPMTMALTATKGQRKPYVVQPLAAPRPTPSQAAVVADETIRAEARAAAALGSDHFRKWFKDNPDKRPEAQAIMPELKAKCDEVDAAMTADPFGLPPLDAQPDPLPPTATDDEIQAQIAREIAERNAAMEA